MKLKLSLILLFFAAALQAQNLNITSSGGDVGTSGTNWSLSGSILTVTGTANIRASVIVDALTNGNLSVVGNSTNFAVTVSETINSTSAGSGLTIGSMTNTGAITVGADITLAGGIAIMGGDVQLNGNITSTATGDLFFQGLGNVSSIRLATGKTIEKTAGTGLLTMQGNGRINNSTSVGSILASGLARLDVVIINEMDNGTAGLKNVSTGNITTNGGHLWISAGAKNRIWNGLNVGSTGVPGNLNYNGIDVTGNISTNGGDVLLWAFVGSAARSAGYGDIAGLSSNRTISSGSGDITLMTHYNDFVDSTPDINISTTGKLTFAPASGASFDVALSFAGSTTSGTFTGSGGMDGLIIQNFNSLNELVIGTYNGTGALGDTPYTPANTADITLDAAISIAGPITIFAGDITVSQNLTSTLLGADILLQATGAINLASSKTIETSGGDVTLSATSGGMATALVSAIDLNSSSQILSYGGNITLGGGYAGSEGNLYAATNKSGGGYAVNLDAATTLNAAGGNIKIYGRNVLSYGDGIYLSAVNISTLGSGTIGIYGDSYGGKNGSGTFFGGITFENNASTIQTVNGNLTLKGILTNSQSSEGYAINFYRSPGLTGQTKHIQILSQTGEIQITADRGASNGQGIGHSSWGHIYFGSPLNNSYVASGDIKFTYSNLVNANNNGLKVKTTGEVTYEPAANSFISAQTFPANANATLADGASSLTIGKSGNTADITIDAAQTIAGPISIYGGTVAVNGALSATNATLSIESSTAVTQTAAITASNLALTGAGTVTLNNTSNAIETIAGGTATNRLGSLSFTDASGGLTIGTIGSLSGIYTNTGVVSVETLTGNINLNESVSTNNTTAAALIINAGKNANIGVSSGGDIQVSGTPAITTGSGGIAKLFSGLESNSTGLTGLVGANNARFSYDEITTTFVPALAVNNAYAIYRTSLGTGDLTIVSSGGEAINSTWKYENGVISTTASPVYINASILQDYLSSGALTIEAGNVTISGAITSTTNAAFVINSNGTKTITVNAAVSLGGAITFNSNDFMLGNGINISTSSASNITINANGNFGTTSTTRRTISSANGTIIIHADKDANGTGQLDLDYLTFNPGTGATIIRGETRLFTTGSSAGPYINGTGSFTFEPSDPSFGEVIYTSWFEIDKDNNGISALTLGKIGNSSNIEQNTNFTIAGPIQYYGGYVNINGTLTSSANGDILLKGIANTTYSVAIQSGKSIIKSSGSGTLTMQGHGWLMNNGTITTSGTGILNVVLWSDFDNSNNDGGISQNGTISTNGGDVWLGGSNSNGGSFTWNGLAVGDGPSIGTAGYNSKALYLYGNVTTNGGDFLAWAGTGVIAGIYTDTSTEVNVGSGNLVLITPTVLGTGDSLFFRQSGGTFTLVPNGSSFPSTLDWSPYLNVYGGMTGWNFSGDFNYLWIENPSTLTNLTVGRYDGMTNGGTPMVMTNSSAITIAVPSGYPSQTTTNTIAGSMNFYGGAITLNTNIITTNTTNGNIALNGTSIAGTGNIALAAGRTATLNVSATSAYDGVVSGTGSALTKSGSGKLMLTKDQTYSGATTITAGDLQVGTGGSVSQASSGSIANTTAVAVASGSKLILTPNEDIDFDAPISGDGGVEIKGASGAYYNSYLTGTAATIATNSTVLEVLTRITGGYQLSANVNGTAGVYLKSYNAATNTATFQFQQFEGMFTKCVFVQLLQSGSNVQIRGNTSIYNGAAYRTGNYIGADLSTGSIQIGPGLATSSGGAGYGISKVYMSGKVNFTGNLTYTGNTSLTNTVTNGVSGNLYSYISKGTQEITDASSSFPSTSTVINNGLVIFNRTTPLTVTSTIEGTEDVLQVGAAVTLTGTCTHSGLTTVDLNKSLIIGNGATSGSITGNIINYGTLTFNRSNDSNHAGVISGSGSLIKLGEGTHTLTGLNTYAGATTITAGKLVLERDVPVTSSTGYSGAGTLVIQPASDSFTSAVSYPIAGFTISNSIGGLTLGKPTNTAPITFANATTIAGPITAYGGTITANANLETINSSDASILLQGSKVIHNQGVSVQTNGSNITYNVTNSPWTAAADQGILLGIPNGTIATINAQGGNISLTASFASSGVTNSGTNPDVAILMRNSAIKTSGVGTVTLNGNAYDNASTNGDFIWGTMLHTNEVIQTEHGAISITGTGGKTNGNARGIIADNTALKVVSASGPITFTEVMPNGHSIANHSGTYFKPAATNAIKIGADGTLVPTSTSNVVFDVARITFDGAIAPTVVNTSGTVTIQPVGNQFDDAVSLAGLSLSNTATGLTIGKPTNTAKVTFANVTSIAGPITAYGGTITLDANLTTTNNGAISLYSDNPLGGLNVARTLTAAGAFKYIPRGTAFTADVTYPITNLTATSTGLTIGKTTNDKNITITQDVTGGAGIALYGTNVNINSNLKTTNSGAMYFKGNTTIAAGKYIESNGTFTHDGNMTFKSNASGTAGFGPLGGTFTTVSGSSTVERYIPARRAYRFLSPSVTTTSSIRQNWQEGGANTAGLGTHITGVGGATNGFDTTATNNASLFTFTSGAWAAVTNTTTATNTLTAGTAYRLMVRGDRTVSLSTNTPTATATTLRATGTLQTGDFTPALNQVASGYSFIGNPYQAPVDIKAVLNASSNMNTGVVYYWDPTKNARGAYVTRTLSTNSSNSPESAFTEILQPGQAVFVKNAVTGTPSMTFNEINKVMTNSTAAAGIFRAATTNDYGMLRVNLKANVNNQWEVIEGALALFHPSYSWGVTEEDANKFSNLDEEVSFMQNSTSLAIAMQSNPAITDELPMKLNNTRYTSYQWQFELTDYNGLTPYLLDTQNNTYTQIDNATIVPFTVNGQENTRFRIVFQNNALGTPTFDNQVVLYPNPASSSTSGFYLQGIAAADVAMHTLLGQKIPVQTSVSGTSLHVTTKQGLSKGVYIVSITQEGITSQVKWIVE